MTDWSPEWTIRGSGYVAVVAGVGATLRRLEHNGRDLVVPFGAEEIRPVYRGALIAPWPNRIADGRYSWKGRDHQLPLNEVSLGHALHGLVQWIRWEPIDVHANRLVLAHDLVPQDGYPFALSLRVAFEVGDDGLTTVLRATNRGAEAVPYGCCPHPYLTPGSGRLDDWLLTLPASRRVEVDERLIPSDEAAVDAVDCDFRADAVIGDRQIDHAFTGLGRGADGDATVRIVDPEAGTGVQMSWGAWASWVQIHTADRPEPSLHRAGLAVEPMSCLPDAFNDPAGAPSLAPGAAHEAAWTISVTA